MTLHALIGVAAVVVAAFLAGRLIRRRVPELVGYVLVGALLGPTGAHLFGRVELHTLEPLVMIPVAFLMFLIGERTSLAAFRRVRWMGFAAPMSYLVTAGLVYLAARAAGASLELAAMLAVLGGSGAPMTVASVVNGTSPRSEYGGSLIGLHASCDALAALAFAVVFPIVDLTSRGAGENAGLVWQVMRLGLAGALLGGLLGLSLSNLCARTQSPRAITAATLAHIAGGTAISFWLGFSVPLAALVMGAVVASRCKPRASELVFGRLSGAAPALFLVYSTLAGAAIRLGALPAMGAIGLAYVATRALGKLAGAQLAAAPAGMTRLEALRVGLGSLPHAGIAVGLATAASSALPGQGIATIPLTGVVIFEIVGAVIVRAQLRGWRPAGARRSPRAATPAPSTPGLVPAPAAEAAALEPAG